MNITINPEAGNLRIVYKGSNGAKDLKDRTQEELKALAIIALKSKNKHLLGYFKDLPSLEDLQKEATGKLIKEGPKKPVAQPNLFEN